MRDVVSRLYRTRLVLSCFILVGTGIALLVVADWISTSPSSWLRGLPLAELGGTLIGAGILGVWLDHFMRREQEAVDERRLRALLLEQAPAMRDAVLQAFAADHEDLRRVATPEMLDQVITNSLALRLEDKQFASEVYADIRDQAIGALERWHDAILSIELSEPDVSHLGPKAGAKFREEYLAVTVRWEYTVVPKHPIRRFVCLSDRDEYLELANERGATSAWLMPPDTGVDANSPEAFQLVRFTVDGDERTIRRTSQKGGQAYAVSIGGEALEAGKPVTIAYTYQLTMRRDGNYLFFDIEQPTRDVRVDFDYEGVGLEAVSVLDLIPSVRRTIFEQPHGASGPGVVRLDIQGWVFPRSGVAFVWTTRP